MAHMQISTETSTWLLQAKEFLDEARRLRPGPARNELRQVAKVLRELAKLEEHLAVLFRYAANLNLQLCELKRLRDRVRQAQRRARKSQRTNLTGTREEWLAARRHAKNPGEGTLHRLARGESPSPEAFAVTLPLQGRVKWASGQTDSIKTHQAPGGRCRRLTQPRPIHLLRCVLRRADHPA